MNNIRDKILSCLEEIGIYVENPEDDFDLTEYINDSVEFISFIIGVEEALDVEIPDDFLMMNNINSFNAYCKALSDLILE